MLGTARKRERKKKLHTKGGNSKKKDEKRVRRKVSAGLIHIQALLGTKVSQELHVKVSSIKSCLRIVK